MPPNNELMPNMSLLSSSSFVRRCIVVDDVDVSEHCGVDAAADDVGLDCSCVLLISLRFFFNVESKADAYVKKKTNESRGVFLLLTVIVDNDHRRDYTVQPCGMLVNSVEKYSIST